MTKNYFQASQFLTSVDADWSLLIERVGPCTLETRPDHEPYEALIRAISHQQLHARAGDAILNRFLALFPDSTFPSPDQILSIEPQTIRLSGFSERKVNTIRHIAEALLIDQMPTLAKAKLMSNDELIKLLTLIPGIGPWTVEMFLIFTLERMDILPIHDFGVKEGYRKMKGLPKQPTPKELAKAGEIWSPYRTIASWYLWRA